MPNLELIGLFGLSGSGKSWRATDMFLECPRGIFITFRGIPDDHPARMKIPSLQKSPETVLKALEKYPHYEYIADEDFIWVLKELLKGENYCIVLDDVFVLIEHSGDIAGSKNVLDSFLKEARQKGIKVIITTHRTRKEISTFIQENMSEIYLIGGCSTKKMGDTLLELSNMNIPEDEMVEAMKKNPPQTAYLIRKL